MDCSHYDFVLNHQTSYLSRLLHFKHRTFNDSDLLYFIQFFKFHYSKNSSLESAFAKWLNKKDQSVEKALDGFFQYFFSLPDVPQRTKKLIAASIKNSGCKRLNMLLRWMVRKVNKGVDFGIRKKISYS